MRTVPSHERPGGFAGPERETEVNNGEADDVSPGESRAGLNIPERRVEMGLVWTRSRTEAPVHSSENGNGVTLRLVLDLERENGSRGTVPQQTQGRRLRPHGRQTATVFDECSTRHLEAAARKPL